MNWIEFFKGIKPDITFFAPITDTEIANIKAVTGIELSGDLLDLLLQTNGIRDNTFSDYLVYSSDFIIERFKYCQGYFNDPGFDNKHSYLFFADDGCGDFFGHEVKDGRIISPEICYYYPIAPDEYRVVASDLRTWATEWYSGRLLV